MAAILKKAPKTKKEILVAIYKIASDKNQRVMLEDQVKWLEAKLREIRKLARKLREGQ